MPVITDLSLTITPATALYASPISDGNIVANESTLEGRNAIVLDFNQGDGVYARDLGTTFQWPTAAGTILYVWQPSLLAMPESIYGRPSDWDDGGHEGDKFIQGITIEADSFNAPKTFRLQSSDDLSFHPLLETPATFNKQSVKSFSCAPFVSHSVRLVSSDNVPWRVWSQKLVFQPWPSACLNWQTELTSLGLTGWGHVREMNIPHVSTADLNLTLTFDDWPTINLTIPNSGGVQDKVKVTLPPNKFKLISLQLQSTQVFRLFATDLELKIKKWGSAGEYDIVRPFGGPSSPGATV